MCCSINDNKLIKSRNLFRLVIVIAMIVAAKSKDKDTQAKVGQSIAAKSSNPIVKAAAKNSVVQSAVGSAVGFLASNKEVRNAVGNHVAKEVKKPENRGKLMGALSGRGK